MSARALAEFDLGRALVVGAGIGGLTVAGALARLGLEVEVAERTPSLEAVGAGISLQPNAMAVLSALGVQIPAQDQHPIGPVAMVDAEGVPIMAAEAPPGGDPARSINIRRPDLHAALAGPVDPRSLHLGRAFEGFVAPFDPTGPASIGVRFSDGTRGSYDLVVGADGIRSAVRAALLDAKHGVRTRYAGQTCWRLVVEAPELVPERTVERWSPGQRVGLVPLSRGGIYAYLVLSAPRGTVQPGSDTLAHLRATFVDRDPRLGALLDRAAEDPGLRIHHGDLEDQPRIHFGRGRVVLIGDAAHALTPNLGQGAAMAIEDAAALLLALAGGAQEAAATPDQLATTLDRRRRARVAEIHRISWRLGQIAHMRGPLRRRLRDALLRRMARGDMEARARAMLAPGVALAREVDELLRARGGSGGPATTPGVPPGLL